MYIFKKALAASAILAFTLLAACSSSDPKPDENTTETQSQPENKTVRLFSYKFSPSTITINVGDSITFQNSDPDVRNISIPALNVDQTLDKGKSWTYTFNTAGEYGVTDRMNEGATLTIIVQ